MLYFFNICYPITDVFSNIVMWTGETPPVLAALAQLSAGSATETDKLEGLNTLINCCQVARTIS
jgi:hypothetical protein